MNKELALGVFISFALLVFLSFLFFLGNFSIGKYYTFDIMFTDVSGLPVKASIKMNGVKVGTVASIVLYRGEAKVAAKIRSDVHIPKNSVFSIMTTGVVGSKYLDIRPIRKGAYDDEDTEMVFIKEHDAVRGVAPVNMNHMMEQVMRIVDEFTSNGDVKKSPIVKAINNLEQITDKINKGLGRDERDFREVVVNIKEASHYLKEIGADIDDLVKNNKDKINKDIDKFSYVMDNAKKISDKLNILLDNLNTGNGTIATLINDEKMAEELKQTVKDVKKLTNSISTIEVSWDVDLRNNSRDNKTRVDFGFVIAPRKDKRYLLSIDNIATDKLTKYDEGNQKYNTITALIEKDFGDHFTVHAGSMRSSGGIGAEYRPFNTKIFGIDVDMYRFDRETETGKKVVWIDSFIRYQINKWTNIKVGAEDVLESPGFTAGVNVTVYDEDISSLFGLTGLSALKT